ncbi:hypothetical protein ACL02R_18320 [Streptomyces sp. MS19]|uniref:hypothetical protein n=1 Tax=Streptomyces sp. MS19 TaxID=3385972 RepID=UPI0039A2A370
MFDHQRSEARVTSVAPWGVLVVLEDGTAGLVDKAKLPAWRNDAPLPQPGDSLSVVVLDATRDPVRVSALPEDAALAERARALAGGLVNEVVRLREADVPARVREARAWVARHRDALA